MGDQIGQAVEGTLYYIPYTEFQRIRTLNLQCEQRAAIFADMCRLNALYMIARAGSGHIGSSFSSLDIISWLLLEEMCEEDISSSSNQLMISRLLKQLPIWPDPARAIM